MDFGLAGRTVCVTGGASGIGLATVIALANDGARVAILDRSGEAVDVLCARLRSQGAEVSGDALDVRDATALRAAADRIEAILGPIEGLVAAAGVSGAARAEDLTDEEFTRVLDINVKGLFLSCQEVGRRMIARKRGAIVTIGSVNGAGGHPGRAHYVASKFAVRGITQNLALEWGRFGVRVNCVAPNLVDTPMVRTGLPGKFLTEVVYDRTPMGRMAQPSEIAGVALMLLSDAASFINGVFLPVDGGLTAGAFTHDQGADLSSTALLASGVYSER